MIGAIPNPKKTLTIDYSIESVLSTIEYIPSIDSNYGITNKNDVLKLYTFEATEFLSLGIYADVSLNSNSESKTEITIEIRRKIGAFDNSIEVQKANKHIEKLFDALSKCITLTPKQLQDIEIEKQSNQSNKQIQSKVTMMIVCWFLGGLGIHRLMMGYSNWWLMLITLGGCGIWTLIDLIQIATGSMKMADGRDLT